jgi:mono/diheme cytochrome c family protein
MRAGLLLSAVLVLSVSRVASGAQDAAAIEKGKQIYAAQKCAMCHALQGKGNKMSPLDGVGSKLSADDLRKWIVSPKEMEAKLATKSKVSMKAFPTLPKDDLDALVAYLASLKQ